jgi:hypothetical protein
VVALNDSERDYILTQYDDCLCASCLMELKNEYKQKQLEEKINRAYVFFNLKSPFKNE